MWGERRQKYCFTPICIGFMLHDNVSSQFSHLNYENVRLQWHGKIHLGGVSVISSVELCSTLKNISLAKRTSFLIKFTMKRCIFLNVALQVTKGKQKRETFRANERKQQAFVTYLIKVCLPSVFMAENT